MMRPNWPTHLYIDTYRYRRTGAEGNRSGDFAPGAEYERIDDDGRSLATRLWLWRDGLIELSSQEQHAMEGD